MSEPALRLVALAGLPGTGKSTLARALAPALDAAVLSKDEVRRALFGRFVAYDPAQDDLVVGCLLRAALDLRARGAAPWAVLDGRTFTRAASVTSLRAFCGEHALPLAFVECVCPPAVARDRIARDAGTHPAEDRTPARYDTLRAAAEPLAGADVLRVDTHALATEEQVAAVVAWLGGR